MVTQKHARTTTSLSRKAACHLSGQEEEQSGVGSRNGKGQACALPATIHKPLNPLQEIMCKRHTSLSPRALCPSRPQMPPPRAPGAPAALPPAAAPAPPAREGKRERGDGWVGAIAWVCALQAAGWCSSHRASSGVRPWQRARLPCHARLPRLSAPMSRTDLAHVNIIKLGIQFPPSHLGSQEDRHPVAVPARWVVHRHHIWCLSHAGIIRRC